MLDRNGELLKNKEGDLNGANPSLPTKVTGLSPELEPSMFFTAVLTIRVRLSEKLTLIINPFGINTDT